MVERRRYDREKEVCWRERDMMSERGMVERKRYSGEKEV